MVNHKLAESLTARLLGQLQYGERSTGVGMTSEAEAVYLMVRRWCTISIVIWRSKAGCSYDRVGSDDADQPTVVTASSSVFATV